MSNISIIGSGIVGEAVGVKLKKLGNHVIFIDFDEKRVRKLRDLGLDATTEYDAIAGTEISFLCVPTPTKNGEIDLSYVKSAVKQLANVFKSKSGHHTLVVKSTVIPTTTEKVIIPLLQECSGKKVGEDISVCVCPEFLPEARRFDKEKRIVIGEFDRKSGDIVKELLEPVEVPIIRTDMRTAEMIKYACNCALANRISYWNEVYYICLKLGIDSDLVGEVAAMDERIGKYGTNTGRAFGGRCLPKDLAAFISFAEKLDHEPELLKAVAKINERLQREGLL